MKTNPLSGLVLCFLSISGTFRGKYGLILISFSEQKEQEKTNKKKTDDATNCIKIEHLKQPMIGKILLLIIYIKMRKIY